MIEFLVAYVKVLVLMVLAVTLPEPKRQPTELKSAPPTFNERYAPVESPAIYPSNIFRVTKPWHVTV